jgi:two-component system OmpR family sensor kinase
MPSLSRLPLRWRLTLAFTIVTAVVLAALGFYLHERLGSHLDNGIAHALRQRAGDLASLAADGRSGLGTTRLVEQGDDLAQVLDREGRVVDAVAGFRNPPLLTRAEVQRALRGTITIERRDIPQDDGDVKLLATPAGGRVAVVGADLEDRDEALRQLDGLLVLGIPAALLLATGAAFVAAGRALRPVDEMRSRADAIHTGRLSERLPVPEPRDELRRLAATLNSMLARLEAGFARERTFVADAGHELRTPLARLRIELELAQRPGRSREELADAVSSAADEVERLRRLSEDLLLVARADQGELPVRPEAVPAAELVELARRQATAAGRVFTSNGDAGLQVNGDRLRLQQALGNLVDNAVRHGAGAVELGFETDDGHVTIHVRDEGPGFAEGFEQAAFERFRRGDEAREGDSAGLGLAIVDAVARAHGGSAGAATQPGGGADVWIRLPGGGPTIRRHE